MTIQKRELKYYFNFGHPFQEASGETSAFEARGGGFMNFERKNERLKTVVLMKVKRTDTNWIFRQAPDKLAG